MRTREATRKEVKMHFLLADAFKPVVEKDGLPTNPPQETFLREYEGLLRAYQAYSEQELDDRIREKDPVRLARYNFLNWSFATVALNDISPWPEMDGLDIRLTTGTLPETVANVDAELTMPSGLRIHPNFMPKIGSIRTYRDLIIPRFPIILFPGGLERGNHNHWVTTSGEVPKNQQKDWICKISRYDNDAGNSRAFAYLSSGLLTVDAYFGETPGYTRHKS